MNYIKQSHKKYHAQKSSEKNTNLAGDALRNTQLWDLGGYLTVNLSETQRGLLQVQFPGT